MTFHRVRNKATGTEETVSLVRAQHEPLNKPAVSKNGKPLPPKPRQNINDKKTQPEAKEAKK